MISVRVPVAGLSSSTVAFDYADHFAILNAIADLFVPLYYYGVLDCEAEAGHFYFYSHLGNFLFIGR